MKTKKKCNICGKDGYGKKELCFYHYAKEQGYYNKKHIRKNARKCLINECNIMQYCKGYCRKHYAAIVRGGYSRKPG